MRDLLLAIRSELQGSDYLSYIRDENIIVTEFEGYPLKATKLPLITIKDHGSINDQQLTKRYYQTSRVAITIFNRVLEIGDVANSGGILKIEEDVFNELIDNKLNISDVTNAFPIIQEPTKNIIRGKDIISYKRIIFEYTRYKNWN